MITTNGLTNTQILETGDKRLLTSIQKQVRFIMEEYLQRKRCPNCGELHSVPEASGKTVDDFNFSNSGGDRAGPCRKCGRTLIFTLPIIGGWHWRLDPEEYK